MLVIVYRYGDGIAVDIGKPTMAHAERIVPTGEPFWIIDGDEIPMDPEFRDSWDIDPDLEPTGYGGGVQPEEGTGDE